MPALPGNPDDEYERAYEAEQIIRSAIENMPPEFAVPLLIVFGLTREHGSRTLEQRRQAAAERLGIQAETFRRANHEGQMILDLAMAIYAQLRQDKEPPDTAA